MKQSIFSAEEFKKLKPDKGGKRQKHEEKIQLRVCAYLKKAYPQIIFQCDIGSGMNLGKKIGGMNTRLRSSRGMPDLMIFKPRWIDSTSVSTVLYLKENGYRCHGLFIELKTEFCRLKNGNIARTAHHLEQEAILKRLRELGYMAKFAFGYEDAIKIIDEYL